MNEELVLAVKELSREISLLRGMLKPPPVELMPLPSRLEKFWKGKTSNKVLIWILPVILFLLLRDNKALEILKVFIQFIRG